MVGAPIAMRCGIPSRLRSSGSNGLPVDRRRFAHIPLAFASDYERVIIGARSAERLET